MVVHILESIFRKRNIEPKFNLILEGTFQDGMSYSYLQLCGLNVPTNVGIIEEPKRNVISIGQDPLFNLDYSLRAGSPGIDSGTSSIYGYDINKDIRPLDGNGNAEWDIRAYEYSQGSIPMQSIPKSSSIFSTIWNWIKGLLVGREVRI